VQRTRRWVIVAASGVAAVLAGIYLLRSASTDTGERLRREAATLAKAHPDTFGDFRPLTAEERRTDAGRRERAGLVAVYPGETILETRPRLRWEGGGGMDRYEVRLYTVDGAELWKESVTESSTLLGMTLKPGEAYVWEVGGRGPLGDDRAQRRFEVAGPEERRVLEAALDIIAGEGPPDLVPLLQAQFAMRNGLYGEAERRAREFLAGAPGDRVGRETLWRVLRQLGSSEASALFPEAGE
jgi:hypothetical protein